MSDSGEPKHWPFELFDPATFKPPIRKVSRVFLHCSAWDGKAVGQKLAETINEWHLANGWSGVGYHFLIDHLGNVCTGRPLEETPAAQLGKDGKGNVSTIAIMTNGLWDFTEEALKSTQVLCTAIDIAYTLLSKPVTFHGHCEIDPKPCPVYNYPQLLGLDIAGTLHVDNMWTPAEISVMAKDKAAAR